MKQLMLSIQLWLFTFYVSHGQSLPVVSSSGFFPYDSVSFAVPISAPNNHSLWVAVNCYTDCFVPYTGPITIYNRNPIPNTWENQQLSKAPDATQFEVDTNATRGLLKKVNVVRVKRLNAVGNLDWEKTYFIGLHSQIFTGWHSTPVVHLFVDSNDAFGPEGFYGPGIGLSLPDASPYGNAGFVWNYHIDWGSIRFKSLVTRERVEKPAHIEIMAPSGSQSLLSKTVGIRLTGASSLDMYNRSLQVVARNTYSSGKMETNLFGTRQKHKWLRFRTGGAGQQFGFCDNEIGVRIMNGLKMGEVKVKPVVVYLNGSYWTFAFAQQKLGEDLLEEYYDDVDAEDVHIFEPSDLVSINDVEFNSPLFTQTYDTSLILLVTSPTGNGNTDKLITGILKAGSKERLTPVIQTLVNLSNEPDQYKQYRVMDSVLDMFSALRYLAVTDFLQAYDFMDNNIEVAADGKRKPYILAKDFDDIWGNNLDTIDGFASGINHWLFTEDSFSHRFTFGTFLMRDLILKNPYGINWLVRVYQDLLNTTFKYSLTGQAVDEVYCAEFFNEFDEHVQAWGGAPNGGFYSTVDHLNRRQRILTYLQLRPDSARQILADHWMPQQGYTLNNLKNVHLVLDSVPAGLVQVKLNSITQSQSWEGRYYPFPSLITEMIIDSALLAGNVVIWKEYPDSAAHLELFADNDIILTPVLKQASDVAIRETEGHSPLKIYPNPAHSSLTIIGPLDSYEIIDLSGKKLDQGTGNTVNLNNLANGLYLLVMHQGTLPAQVKKIIKE